MKIFFLIYGILFFVAIVAVVVRIMTRRAIIVSTSRVYISFGVAFLLPLLISFVFLTKSVFELSSAFGAPDRAFIMLIPILCLVGFSVAVFVLSYYIFRRSVGDIILINIEEYMIFDEIEHILKAKEIAYDVKQTRFLVNDEKGSIRVIAKVKSSLSFLQFTNANQHISTVIEGLKKDFEGHKNQKMPWWVFLIFLPLLPLLSIVAINIPGLENVLEIDLSSLGELPRTIGGRYGARGMYLSGQIMGLGLLLFAIRVWIRRPLIITPTVLRVVAIIAAIHIFSLFLTSLSNYTLHVVLLVMCLLVIGLIVYFLRTSGKYYGFVNISPDSINRVFVEVLNRRNIPFSENRYGLILEGGTEIKLQTSWQSGGLQISKPENHKELIKDFINTIQKEPSQIFLAANLLILLMAVWFIVYWFSPYIFYILAR